MFHDQIRSSEKKKFLKEAQWRTLTDTRTETTGSPNSRYEERV